MEEQEIPQYEQKEKIKLIRNTKGYNWEISVLSLDVDLIEKINSEMQKRFEIKL